MNKRIQDLAEQAWDATAVSPDFGHPVSFAEKFAELIVRQTMDYASRNWEHGHLLAEDLKVYFGVK